MFKDFMEQDITCLKMSRSFLNRPLRYVYAYFVDGLAIEGGIPYCKRELADFYRHNKLQQALFTHSHEDHAGNIDLLNQLGIVPYVHAEAINYLSSLPRLQFYRRFVWGGAPGSGKSQQVKDYLETDKYSFKVLPTTGHSPDHLCLFEQREGWLFTGDLYVGEKLLYLYKDENMAGIIDSLKMLSTLDFAIIFCSHFGPVKQGPETIKRKLAYIEEMQEKAIKLHNKGLSLKEITTKLLGKEDYMYYITRGDFSKLAFISGLLQST